MKIIGLSGSIAAGKNFIADSLKIALSDAGAKNVQIFDADTITHQLILGDQDVTTQLKEKLPEALVSGVIDRFSLGRIVFNSDRKLKILEDILHPKIRHKYNNFLKECKIEGVDFIILNIPLLLEKKEFYRPDLVIAVLVDIEVRKRRFLKRQNLVDQDPKYIEELLEKFRRIDSKQSSDQKRSSHADFVVDNSCSQESTIAQLKQIVLKILNNGK